MATKYSAAVTTAGINSAQFEWEGGPGEFYVSGAFGGATIGLQQLVDDGTWIDVAASFGGAVIALVAAGHKPFELPRGQMRFHLSVVGAGAVINCLAVRKPQARV